MFNIYNRTSKISNIIKKPSYKFDTHKIKYNKWIFEYIRMPATTASVTAHNNENIYRISIKRMLRKRIIITNIN